MAEGPSSHLRESLTVQQDSPEDRPTPKCEIHDDDTLRGREAGH
jgi:hypothetical protein